MWDGPDGEGLSRAHIARAVEDSLRRLQVETIDLYQTHWPDENTPIEETLTVFGELIAAGKVRYIGLSNYTDGADARGAARSPSEKGLPRFVSLQPHYNLVWREEYEVEQDAVLRDERHRGDPVQPARRRLPHRQVPPRRAAARRRRAPTANRKFMTDDGFAVVEALEAIAGGRRARRRPPSRSPGCSRGPPSPRRSSARTARRSSPTCCPPPTCALTADEVDRRLDDGQRAVHATSSRPPDCRALVRGNIMPSRPHPPEHRMTTEPDTVSAIEAAALRDLQAAADLDALEEWRARLPRPQGAADACSCAASAAAADRGAARPSAARQRAEAAPGAAHERPAGELEQKRLAHVIESERLDVTLPGPPLPRGRLHPVTQTLRDMLARVRQHGLPGRRGAGDRVGPLQLRGAAHPAGPPGARHVGHPLDRLREGRHAARCCCARTPRRTRSASWSSASRRSASSCPASATASRRPTPRTSGCSRRSRAWPSTRASA